MLQSRPDGRLYAVAGASRSGKTVRTAQDVRGARRLLVWDLKGEWTVRHRCRRVGSLEELRELVKPGAKPERIAYHSPAMLEDHFDPFCRLAWVWIRSAVGTLVVEETASVTHPGKAPPGWGNIVRMGLGYGATIYALTQRPAESDKTAFGNASVVRSGRLSFPDDRTMLARYLSAPVAEVESLRPLEFMERDHVSGELRRVQINPKLRT